MKVPTCEDELCADRRTPELFVNIDVVHVVQSHVREPYSHPCDCTVACRVRLWVVSVLRWIRDVKSMEAHKLLD